MNINEVRSKPKPVKVLKVKKKLSNKPSSRGKVIKIAHALMRDIVMARDGKCVVTIAPANGHSKTRQAGHLINSTKGSVRFDLRNVHEQCSGCNRRHVNYPHYYEDWFVQTFGAETHHQLTQDSNVTIPLKTYELEELCEQLAQIKERQVNDPTFIPRFSQKEILSGAWAK